ncbi:hypothetical protein JQ507_17925 [Bradyrhizobium sp. PSBB068]|nr:hypothetical protein JQ507_17925 [Bradyrhizobium sp. PSBB068]
MKQQILPGDELRESSKNLRRGRQIDSFHCTAIDRELYSQQDRGDHQDLNDHDPRELCSERAQRCAADLVCRLHINNGFDRLD